MSTGFVASGSEQPGLLSIKGFLVNKRSALWGGATLGLIVGIIVGIFRDNFWSTVVYAVLIGIGVGMLANILGWISDTMGGTAKEKRKEEARESWLNEFQLEHGREPTFEEGLVYIEENES